MAIVAMAAIAIACGREEAARDTSPSSARPDVILVTIDTLRADALGYAGSSRVETPFLDRLAAEGRVFTNAHAHNVVTLPSHANILTGLLPYQHGVRDNTGFVFREELKTLGDYLRDDGYRTGAFVGAFPLDARYGLNHGFEVYDDNYSGEGSIDSFKAPERSAQEVLEAARRWWKSNEGRERFLWVHLYDPHAPYLPPEPFRSQYSESPYYGEVAWVDHSLGEFLRPILSQDRSVMVVVTSDHGEALGEHGEETHGLFAYEETLAVPLLIWERESVPPSKDERFVRHIDLAPTILKRVGIAIPESLHGESLLTGADDRETYFESMTSLLHLGGAPIVGTIRQRHKFIDVPIPELYDLVEDPDEARNIIDDERRLALAMREELRREIPAEPVHANATDSEESRKLLSLGYFAGGGGGQREFTTEDDPKNLAEAYGRLQRVVTAYQSGDASGTIQLAQQLVREYPQMTIAKDILTHALQEDERPEEARDFLEREVAKGTANDSLRRRLGLILAESGEAERAVEILSEFSSSRDPDLLNAYGIALADVGRTEEATGVFRAVLEIDPNDGTAYQNLGIVALRGGDLQGAQGQLSRAIELDPELPLAWNTLGVLYAQTGRTAEAVDAWQKAIDLDPRQYDALFNLGIVAARIGRVSVARAALERFVEVAPSGRYGPDIAQARQLLAQLPEPPH